MLNRPTPRRWSDSQLGAVFLLFCKFSAIYPVTFLLVSTPAASAVVHAGSPAVDETRPVDAGSADLAR